MTLGLVSLAGCMDGNDTAGDPADPGMIQEEPSAADPRIPDADDPGWEPFGEGLPRELMPQHFTRLVFLQEPESAYEEKEGEGSPGFNMTEVDEMVGPLEVGLVHNPGHSFPPSWDIVFRDVNWDNRSILIEHDVADGEYHDVEELPGGITIRLKENETMLVNRLDLEEGGTFFVEPQTELNQAGFEPGAYRVVSVDEETVHLERHPAGYEAPEGQPGGPGPY